MPALSELFVISFELLFPKDLMRVEEHGVSPTFAHIGECVANAILDSYPYNNLFSSARRKD